MKLCVIPARGGSRRIPGKNIRRFLGRPIITYSIESAKRSACFDRIWVSTDDPEVAKIAAEVGAEVPFTRPHELAGDHVGTITVLRHAIEWARDKKLNPKEVCCIYATAPFLQPRDIRDGLTQLQTGKFQFVVTVTSFEFPIQRAVKRTVSGLLEMVYPEHALTRSQDLEPMFHDAGQMYWGYADAFINEDVIFGKKTYGLVLPQERVQDIDTIEDWKYAEQKFRIIKTGVGTNGCE